MNEFLKAWKTVDRNRVAALLSVLPGAGHLYKHHYASGLGILIGGNILVVFVTVLLSLATAGISLLIVPPLYWVSVAAAAYSIPDWHGHHHWLHPWTPQEKEPEAVE